MSGFLGEQEEGLARIVRLLMTKVAALHEDNVKLRKELKFLRDRVKKVECLGRDTSVDCKQVDVKIKNTEMKVKEIDKTLGEVREKQEDMAALDSG